MVFGENVTAASRFVTEAESLHDDFLAIQEDAACAGCQSAGFGEAILATRLQTAWSNFTHAFLIESALKETRVTAQSEAERIINQARDRAMDARGNRTPPWHAVDFVVQVGRFASLKDIERINSVLSPTTVPKELTDFRDYLVHPGQRTRSPYERVQAKFGYLYAEPEDLLHQIVEPGTTIFTWWVKGLEDVVQYLSQA